MALIEPGLTLVCMDGYIEGMKQQTNKSVSRRKRRVLDAESSENLFHDSVSEAIEDIPDTKNLIGQEVKFWRNERGLTGKRLAELSGLSQAMLTKIEHGKVAPSIQTLITVAAALNVPVSMFFHRLEKARYVSYVPADKRMTVDKLGTRAGHVYELLGHNIGHAISIEPFITILDENAEPCSTFQEEGFKFVHMLEGEVLYRHGDRRFPLRPGDSLIIDAMAPHGPDKLEKLPARIMVVQIHSRFDPGIR